MILLGCFSANGAEGALVTNLQRKMSSTHEEMIGEGNENGKKPEEKGESALTDQKEEFKHLIDMLRNAADPGLCMDLLDNLN